MYNFQIILIHLLQLFEKGLFLSWKEVEICK